MNRRALPKLVTFDATGTLFGLRRPVGELYLSLAEDFSKLKRWGPNLPEAKALNQSFLNQYQLLDAKHPNFGKGSMSPKAWWRSLVYNTFTETQPLLEHSKEFEETYSIFFEDLFSKFSGPDYWSAFPEVPSVLQKLKAKGIKLGVISNFDDRLYSILRSLDLYNYFDERAILISCNSCQPKPAPDMFRAALDIAGVQPSEAIHIGDSHKKDLHGAQAAGMRGFVLARKDQSEKLRQEGVPQEVIVRDLNGLLSHLQV